MVKHPIIIVELVVAGAKGSVAMRGVIVTVWLGMMLMAILADARGAEPRKAPCAFGTAA